MGRPKNSVNRLISYKYRSYFDNRVVFDAKQKQNPEYWVNRFHDISQYATYILSPKNGNSFDINDILDGNKFKDNLHISDDNLDCHFPGPRMNDNLSLEISNFFAYACDEFYHRLNSHNWSTKVTISVQKEILYIISLCEKGFQNSNQGFITRIFLIHHKNKIQRIDGDIAINKADPNHDRLLEIPKKWAKFWDEFLKMAMELKAIFVTKPSAALKKDIEHTDPNFKKWLEEGLKHYLDITNNRITNDKTKFNSLKHILLK